MDERKAPPFSGESPISERLPQPDLADSPPRRRTIDFLANLDMVVVELNDNVIVFDMIGVDASFANILLSTMKNEVSTHDPLSASRRLPFSRPSITLYRSSSKLFPSHHRSLPSPSTLCTCRHRPSRMRSLPTASD